MSSAKRPVLITGKLQSQCVLSQRPVNLVTPPPLLSPPPKNSGLDSCKSVGQRRKDSGRVVLFLLVTPSIFRPITLRGKALWP